MASPAVFQSRRQVCESLHGVRRPEREGARASGAARDREQPMQPNLCRQQWVAPPAEQSEQRSGGLVIGKNVAVACRAKHAPGKASVWTNFAEPGGAPVIERQQICSAAIADQLGPELDLAAELC